MTRLYSIRLRALAPLLIVVATIAAALVPARASALELLCDSAMGDCRAQLLNMINAETVGIDVGMWFMEDDRIAQAIVNRKNAGVAVRMLMDTRSDDGHSVNITILNELTGAGVPMRRRIASGIEHWKAMIFAGQNAGCFGSAKFSADAFVAVTPYVNYVDETIYYTDDPAVVNSFKTKMDDAWADTVSYTNYANVT